MAKPLYLALLLCAVLAASAAAQTSGIAGSSLATPYGAVRLPATTAAPSSAAAAPIGSTAGATPGAGVGAVSARSTTSTAASPVQSGSGGSSAAGTATGAKSVPAWLLCAPSGASGVAPFLTGTQLSCAP